MEAPEPFLDRPRVILFDVMRTLVSEPYPGVMLDFLGMSLSEFQLAKHPTAWVTFEEGRITEAQFFERFFRDGRSFDGPGLRDRMRGGYQWIEGMEPILAELKAAGYEMHALSNYPVWYQLIEESLQVSRYISWTFVSCRTGIRKPARQSYLGAATALDVTPADCLFIDDRQENVVAARDVGMQTIHFTCAAQLRRGLVDMGLLLGGSAV